VSEEPPAAAGTAAADTAAPTAPPGGAWGSTLTCQEFAAVSGVGFAPVGQAFGAAVYAAGSASGSSCPGSFEPLVAAMYQARRTAVDRMTAECAAVGGHGVVGVRLTRGSFFLGGLEFTAVGTAVRAAGVAGAAGPRVPFTSDLSGQDFARLITAGWVPAGLALGIAIRSRHDDRATARQARPWKGNAEVTGWTELVSQSRRDARGQLEQDVSRLGAEGVVLTGMQLRVRERACPVTGGPPRPHRGGHAHRHRHCPLRARRPPSGPAGADGHASRPARPRTVDFLTAPHVPHARGRAGSPCHVAGRISMLSRYCGPRGP
jgi:uncharacterized protein YbjQ (UPF0145 family)